MSAKLLTAKGPLQDYENELRQRAQACRMAGIVPTLAILRVGENKPDLSYERSALKRADDLGVQVRVHALPADAAQNQLLAEIDAINADDTEQGCLMFRPLDKRFDEHEACDRLSPAKDADGMTTTALASIFTGVGEGYPPCTADACLRMLDAYGISVAGKHVVVIGRSLVIGKPVALMLLARNATVTICHSKTEHLADITRSADLVVCATGRPRAYGPEYFVPGQIVLDVGINFDVGGKICGDVDTDAVADIVEAISPVPGGIGSFTTRLVFDHTIQAAERAIARRGAANQGKRA
ncbi:MAG: bifunctional 5,10-methylenetetrahydrofolate dehydrogenase/5,10-methenyltetrahydrofolate cyclohydrolase [Eggerthellaceae bacterium]|jgi:methylenetetrahydrofolate dehydrogenase (NADP+)/methenyltetrahydrofolate cyclohydrolase